MLRQGRGGALFCLYIVAGKADYNRESQSKNFAGQCPLHIHLPAYLLYSHKYDISCCTARLTPIYVSKLHKSTYIKTFTIDGVSQADKQVHLYGSFYFNATVSITNYAISNNYNLRIDAFNLFSHLMNSGSGSH